MKLDNNPVSSEERISAQKIPTSFHENAGTEEKPVHNNSVYEEENSKLTENKWIKNRNSQADEKVAIPKRSDRGN